jgi:hypothetical protein
MGCLAAGLMLITASAPADIVSQSTSVNAFPGATTIVSLEIEATAGESVAGINGQLNYNTAIFHTPTVTAGSGAGGFIALGNEVSPGAYRFVLYNNPTAAMNLNEPVIEFSFVGRTDMPQDIESEITFTGGTAPERDEASSNLAGVSLATDLAPVLVIKKNAVVNWSFYE